MAGLCLMCISAVKSVSGSMGEKRKEGVWCTDTQTFV